MHRTSLGFYLSNKKHLSCNNSIHTCSIKSLTPGWKRIGLAGLAKSSITSSLFDLLRPLSRPVFIIWQIWVMSNTGQKTIMKTKFRRLSLKEWTWSRIWTLDPIWQIQWLLTIIPSSWMEASLQTIWRGNPDNTVHENHILTNIIDLEPPTKGCVKGSEHSKNECAACSTLGHGHAPFKEKL